MITKNKKGFTLAEILVTLGVIGVIASMTVPALVQDVQDAQFRAAWKKTFAEVSQSAKRISQDYAGDLTNTFIGADTPAKTNDFRDKIVNYMNYTKKCNANSALGADGCWHENSNWSHLSGTVNTTDWISYPRAVLSNGALMVFVLMDSGCNHSWSPGNNMCGTIRIDVNGYKGPNKISKDIFGVLVLKNGNVIPMGTQNDIYFNTSAFHCSVTGTGEACSARYLYQ